MCHSSSLDETVEYNLQSIDLEFLTGREQEGIPFRLTVQITRIDKQSRAIGHQDKGGIAPACTDKMDIEISFLPWRQLVVLGAKGREEEGEDENQRISGCMHS